MNDDGNDAEDAGVYLVLTGFGAELMDVHGPYETERLAELAKEMLERMEFQEGALWGSGDTWVKIEERELILDE